MEYFPAIVADDEEAIQQTESDGRNGEEVHGGDCSLVIAQESQPVLAGSGLLGAFRIQREIVRSEMSKPSMSNSPRIRGAPQVEFSIVIRKLDRGLLWEFAFCRCGPKHARSIANRSGSRRGANERLFPVSRR
jgi:hypothetical protein